MVVFNVPPVNVSRAATLRGAAAAIRETVAVQPAPFERVIAARFTESLEGGTSAELWRASWEAGHALTREAAVEYALGRNGQVRLGRRANATCGTLTGDPEPGVGLALRLQLDGESSRIRS